MTFKMVPDLSKILRYVPLSQTSALPRAKLKGTCLVQFATKGTLVPCLLEVVHKVDVVRRPLSKI